MRTFQGKNSVVSSGEFRDNNLSKTLITPLSTYPYRCTNDDDYPSEWLDTSGYMFDDSSSCCLGVFNYANCQMNDICPPESSASSPSWMPTSSPSVAPSRGPTTAPSQTSNTVGDSDASDPCSGKMQMQCRARLCSWDGSRNACIMLGQQEDKLSTQIPASRLPTPMPIEAAATNNSQCNAKANKKSCVKNGCYWNAIYKSCSNKKVTTAINNDINCKDRKFHPRTATDITCSNDDDYPALWAKDGLKNKFFFASADACCASFYRNDNCKVVDICSTSS